MWTENEIQGLKSQEAKDLAIELLQQLQEKSAAPFRPERCNFRSCSTN
jgi:hypothetical protein